jgi:hypothetical protein
VLVGPDPDVCKVKGVMFAGRREFLLKEFGERTFYSILSRLTPRTLKSAMHPIAGEWYDFASIVEYDRAIHASCSDRYPYILELVGAASAELGITRVFHQLDEKELYTFLDNIGRLNDLYQKFGRVVIQRTENGARAHHYQFPCYSPFFCASGPGFLLEVILRHGGKDADVVETRCHCRGDGVCTFEMTWS